jgi:hypothetical protein
MSDLTTAEFREHQATDLPDAALQRLIDAAEAAIAARYGTLAQLTDRRRGGGTLLFLSRRAATIAGVTEGSTGLAANDYTLLPDGMTLRREITGTNAATTWADPTVVTFTPLDDSAERARVTIALVQLDINHNPGLSAEAVGDWSQSYADGNTMHYGIEREAILATLADSRLGFA